MERLNLDEQQVQALRAAIVAANDEMSGTWEPDDDPKRTGEVCPGSAIKLDDDVLASDGNTYRVIAPAPGRERFSAYGQTMWGMTQTSLHLGEVVDRAPADSGEEPMPVWTPPEPVPEPEFPAWKPDIPALRQQAFAQIDQRSDQWFAAGFDFDGVRFSLSERAQIRYTNMQIFAEALVPLTVNALDDTSAVTFTVADELRNFCMTAMAVVTQIVNDGAEQKEIVRGLQTGEELAAYQDPRPPPTDVPLEPGQGV